MSTEKTTTLSIVVGVAAFLAEIIFRNTFSSSTVGVILSVVLAVVILCCTYLVVDGGQNNFSVARKKEENRKREYDEKLYRLLNKRLSEIVKLHKEAIGEQVSRDADEDIAEILPDNNQDFLAGQIDASILEMFSEEVMASDSKPTTISEVQPAVLSIDNGERDRLLESINENIMKSAKFIVKYNKKNQEQAQELTEKSVEDLLQAVKLVEREIQSLGEQLSNLSVSSVVSERETINDLFSGGAAVKESILPKENELSDLFITSENEDETEMPVSDELEDISLIQEDIAADLLSARQEIQSEEAEVRLEDILPEEILRELEEITDKEDTVETNSLFSGEELVQMAEENDENSETETVVMQTIEEVISESEEDLKSSEEEENTPLAEDSMEVSEETMENPEPPVENLTAVDLLRIKQKQKEEEETKQKEARKEQENQEQEEENFIPEKIEVPVQDDSNGIMSAEDIAALFASDSSES